MAYLSGICVAVGDGGRIVRSSDGGLGWSDETSPVGVTLRDVVDHSTFLVAVGDAGTTLRRVSTTTVWDTTQSPVAAALHDVASNGSILVAVGDAGTVLRSIDQGLTWTPQPLVGTPMLRGVGARGNIFVAVGLGGVIVRSTDAGLSWSVVTSPTSEDLFDVTADPARFVAVGAVGTLLHATGTGTSGSWFAATSPRSVTFRGVFFDGTQFLAVNLGFLFIGISFLARQIHAVPSETETVISQIARTVYGGQGILYFGVIIGTMIILILAANTAYAGFPRLSAMLAADGFMPRQLTYRGSRLVYSYGIVALAAVASLLIFLFQASVTRLIPLYAIGVFLSFTLAQAGMSRRWWRASRLQPDAVIPATRHGMLYDSRWKLKMISNGFGALCTGLVMFVFAVTKFRDGACLTDQPPQSLQKYPSGLRIE